MNFSRRNLLAAGAILSLPGFASSAFGSETVTVPSQTGDAAVPVDPKRLAVLDISILENLAYFGLSDRVVGSVTPGAVTWVKVPAGAKLIGGMKTIDIPAVKSVNPDLVFISGRVARAIDEFRTAAPTVCLVPNYQTGAWQSFEGNLRSLGRIFRKEKEVEAAVQAAKQRVDVIAKKAAGEKIAILMMVGGRIIVLPDNGRCSLLTNALGFSNVKPPRTGEAPKKAAPKGNPPPKPTAAEIAAMNEKSFAELAELKPSRIFVLNKDLAVGAKEPKLFADAVKGNAVWQGLDAVKAGRVTELTGPAWYLGEGGVESMSRMLGDVEKALGL